MTGNRGPFPPSSTPQGRWRNLLRLVRDFATTFGVVIGVPILLFAALGIAIWIWVAR